ncbi:MAG: 50S ribosomal protein L29 [Mycoplasmataceae bacterium]|jgi:large subunit ribosomal protein L29|nr:50S ribosomal protein L29 [Mycoplasmataceae bacterium]
MNKELRAKTNEELCSLIMRLKLQLLESRFRMASGELEKTNTLPEIRKTIARALTILNERHIKLSIGTHGITMRNLKTNEIKSITNVVQDALKAVAPKESKKSTLTQGETVKQAINDATTSTKMKKEDVDKPAAPTPIVVKKELKSHMDKKVEKQIIRKTVGGGS